MDVDDASNGRLIAVRRTSVAVSNGRPMDGGGNIGPMGVMKLGVRHGVRHFLEHFLAS